MSSLSGVASLDSTMGALLIGSLIGTALFGLTLHQFFRYFRMYPGDPLRLKVMVAVLWALDSVHVIFIMHTCYHYLVSYYLQPLELLTGFWSLRLVIIINSVITTITHFFFAHRILQHQLPLYRFWAITNIGKNSQR
ncbi:hypothetical protein BV22DRAFT_1132172 [Leucogyrophana mollusca]|uniref:Uncharacterized protein n=1 Tax=Leucogyrophana mollusca TaxID=85980 RepID=A0ACB8B9L7_9AGAM|nr:hypothetical protein BV22DRAFT_1132172 [Leucogyrophana mollusca]